MPRLSLTDRWRARCGKSRTPGSGGGMRKRASVKRLVTRLVPTLHQIGARRVFAGAMGGALAINAPDVMTALGWTGALF